MPKGPNQPQQSICHQIAETEKKMRKEAKKRLFFEGASFILLLTYLQILIDERVRTETLFSNEIAIFKRTLAKRTEGE
jgi:hypothetical protein